MAARARVRAGGRGTSADRSLLDDLDQAAREDLILGRLGDFNGDEIDDLLLGRVVGQRGENYVIYGHTGGFPPFIDLAELLPQNGGDGSIGVVFQGMQNEEAALIAGPGDFNGDGISDLLIGARVAEFEGVRKGGAYLVFGRTGGFPALFELGRVNT